MGSIQTGIQLKDQFTSVIYNIMNAVNLTVASMDDMRQTMNADMGTAGIDGVRDEINQATMAMDELNAAMQDSISGQDRFNQEIQEGTRRADGLMGTIKKVAGAYLGIQTLGRVIELSDTMTQTTARLDLIVDDGGSVEELQNKIYASAQNSRGSYLATADAVSKLGMQAGDAFSSNDEMIMFTELLNKQFVNAGTSVQGIDSVMLQLTQSMAAGKLQGEELNAVLDNAAPIVQNIQQYLEEVQGIDAGNIKELASEGIITADVIKNAMFYASDEINAKFESMPMTFGQVWQSVQNSALVAFQPVLKRMNDIANSEAFQTFANGAVNFLTTLANIAVWVFDLMISGVQFVADNWSVISPIVYGIVAALAVYAAYLGIVKALELASAAAKGVMAVAEFIHVAALAAQTGATISATAAQMGLNGAMYACPIVWIIMLIIALIAIFYAAVGAVNKFAGTSVSATGLITAAFAMLAASVMNLFVVPAWNAIATFVNFIGNVFNDPIAAVKVLFYDMCLTVIGYITNLAHAIEDLLNKIPGVTVDITSGLDSFYSGLEEAQQKVKDESGWVEYMGRMDYADYSEWGNAAYDFGAGVDDAISNFSLSDIFGEADIPNPEDYTSGLGNVLADSGIGDNLGSIAGDTGAIKDSMDITEEDLKYLRDIAEQETVNRYTVAEVSVDMSGMQNTVKNGQDLDGFMSDLTDAVNEAVDSITEGGHT